ncbi:MAG: hypothetical protein KIT14_09550 [bacterium]|nr:hypothetical protein [bacterium]
MLAMGLSWPAQTGAQTVGELKQELDAMKRQMRQMQEMLERQERLIEKLEARPAATGATAAPPKPTATAAPATALDRALEEARASAPPPAAGPTTPGTSPGPAIASTPLGATGANLRLIDLAMDTMVAVGASTATDEELGQLQGGGHDPNRRGFTLQQAELSLSGAVDPYFTGEAHIVFTPDAVELEEAFATTQALPYGLQIQAGQFLTDFGRINPTHPHQWPWIDQPVVNSRFFGPDGLRNPGVRLGWLAPLPWFSQVHLGAQNAGGETAVSFLGDTGGGHDHAHGDAEVDDEPTTVGLRPAFGRDVSDLGDLLYLTRWENAFTLTDSTTALLGGSALFGPNDSGPTGRTTIYGGDLTVKWLPSSNFRGWPYVTWQSEVMARNFKANAVHDPHEDLDLPPATLDDWGFYSQLLWGFHYGWATGVRFEYATGSGPSVGGRQNDPNRADRLRVSPLLTWNPTEFSRLRLQYNYDHADWLSDPDQSTVWLGLEILFGQHPAHRY